MKMVRLPDGFNLERFWEKVHVRGKDECWEWQAHRLEKGYGQLGKVSKELGGQLAHRISWCIHFTEIPLGWDVLHRCDNPPCVNPLHLFLGNDKLNMMDCAAKGRKPNNGLLFQGEKSPFAKLTEAQVLEMRRLNAEEGISGYRIAKQYNLHKSHVYDILARKCWSHI